MILLRNFPLYGSRDAPRPPQHSNKQLKTKGFLLSCGGRFSTAPVCRKSGRFRLLNSSGNLWGGGGVMKRWLAAVAVFAACACHVDIAAADTRAPTLWQRIVSVFSPRPPHPSSCGQHLADNPQTAAATLQNRRKRLLRPTRRRGLRPGRHICVVARPRPVRRTTTAPVETPWVAEPIPDEAPEVAQTEAVQTEAAQSEVPPAAPAKTARKHERREKAKAHAHADTTAALPPSAPVRESNP